MAGPNATAAAARPYAAAVLARWLAHFREHRRHATAPGEFAVVTSAAFAHPYDLEE